MKSGINDAVDGTGVKLFQPTLERMIFSMHGVYFLILLRKNVVQRIC